MKTYQDWGEHQTLTSYLNPGDEVDQEMVDYFCGTLPPQTMTSTVIQIGEPYDHCRNKHRKLCPVFPTIQRSGDQWFYRGLCFAGETQQAQHHIFVTKEAENKEFGYEHFKSLCNSFRYLRHNGCWYGVDTSGKIESPLKQNIVIHIFSADGTQISKVNTKEPEV